MFFIKNAVFLYYGGFLFVLIHLIFILQSPKICTKSVSELEIVRQLNAIRDKILAKADSELNEFLLEMDISLPLFGM